MARTQASVTVSAPGALAGCAYAPTPSTAAAQSVASAMASGVGDRETRIGRLCQTLPGRPTMIRGPMTKSARSELIALLALFAGALALGSSGIFVRLSETGVVASAFWRGALAL